MDRAKLSRSVSVIDSSRIAKTILSPLKPQVQGRREKLNDAENHLL